MPILNSDGASAWPEVFSIDKISNLRQTVGEHHFMAQMMLEFRPLENVRLDPGKIQFYDWNFNFHTGRLGDWCVTGAAMYWDPSLGHKNTDASVCAFIFRDDKSHNIFLHDIMYMVVPRDHPQPLTYQCDLVLEFLNKYKMRRLAVEVNGLGHALPEILNDKITHMGGGIVVQRVNNHTKKEDRIMNALEPLLGAGRLFAHQKIQQTPLLSEMIGWSPIGGIGHDDGLDALSGAINAVPVPIRPMGTTIRTFHANTNFKI